MSQTKKAKQPPRSVKRKNNVPQTAQQTIPYREMLQDGVCRMREGYYTKTIEYDDINYSVASNDDQAAIFDGYCGFLNYFDSALPFQLSFINHRTRANKRYKVNIPMQDDDYNSIRAEYVDMLKGQIARSNNGIMRSKYITFGIPAASLAEARPRMERIESDIIGNFKKLGVAARTLNGYERLEILHKQLNPGWRGGFSFSWADIPKTGMGTKDFIAPTSFDFRQSRTFHTGAAWGAVSYLQILASELSDKLLAELLEVDAEMTITMHVNTVDQTKAIKLIKGKLTDIDKMKMDEQKKAARSGYDIDILPPDLVTFSKDAAALLAELQSRNERMFLLTFTITNTASTKQKLENDVFTVAGICQKYNCALKRLDFQQEQGYMSSLVLGYNGIEIQRGMTTSSTAIFVPFMTQELRMGGQSLYYGMNALSHNVIMADRKKLKAPKGLYCQGRLRNRKSQAVKPLRHKRIDTDTITKGGLPHVKYRIRTLRRLLAAIDKTQRAAARTGRTPRQICPYAAGISAGTPPDTVQPVIAIRAVISPSARGRRSCAEQIGYDSRPRTSPRNHLRGVGIRLTLTLPQHAPTARERSVIAPFYSTHIDNSIPKGADLC